MSTDAITLVTLLNCVCLYGCSKTASPSAETGMDAAASVCVEIPRGDCSNDVPRFAEVQPIFAERCGNCHEGAKGGPWPLRTYEEIANWSGEVRSQIEQCKMPPPDGDIAMTDEEREATLEWLRCELPK